MDTPRLMIDGDSPVLTCMAMDCTYNSDEVCHAGMITVGDDHPQCDMYTKAGGMLSDDLSCVSKCMVGSCYFNESSSCHASGVTLGMHGDHADCLTSRASL